MILVNKSLERKCLRIAQNLAPKDTGNLAFNAIRIRKSTPNSFTINYDGKVARYITFVEEGTVNQKAQRFVNATWIKLSLFLNDYFDGRGNRHRKSYTKSRFEDKNLKQRELVRLRSIANPYNVYQTIKSNLR